LITDLSKSKCVATGPVEAIQDWSGHLPVYLYYQVGACMSRGKAIRLGVHIYVLK